MATILATVRINAAPDLVYGEWMTLDHLPAIVGDPLEEARWLDAAHTRWAATSGSGDGLTAEVTEHIPSQRVAWRSLDGGDASGVVTFTPVGESQTELALRIEYEPEGVRQHLGQWAGVDESRAEGALERFRDRIESPARHEEHKGDSFVGRRAGEAT